MRILDRVSGLHRYYKNRIIEDYASSRWQVCFAISVKLLDMVENNIDDLAQVENLLAYTNSVADDVNHSAWMDLIGTVEIDRLEIKSKFV